MSDPEEIKINFLKSSLKKKRDLSHWDLRDIMHQLDLNKAFYLLIGSYDAVIVPNNKWLRKSSSTFF